MGKHFPHIFMICLPGWSSYGSVSALSGRAFCSTRLSEARKGPNSKNVLHTIVHTDTGFWSWKAVLPAALVLMSFFLKGGMLSQPYIVHLSYWGNKMPPNQKCFQPRQRVVQGSKKKQKKRIILSLLIYWNDRLASTPQPVLAGQVRSVRVDDRFCYFLAPNFYPCFVLVHGKWYGFTLGFRCEGKKTPSPNFSHHQKSSRDMFHGVHDSDDKIFWLSP